MLWSMEMSSHWVEIEADPFAWLLMPPEFPIEIWQDDLSWAMDMSQAVWESSGIPRQRKHVKQLAKALIESRAYMVRRGAWSHMSYVYLPTPAVHPTFVSLGVWRAQGDREQALRFYSCADIPGTYQVDEVTTDHLGTGMRAQSAFQDEPDSRILGYAWRVGDHTDLCLTVMEDKSSLPELIPDVDAFARQIRVVADEDDGNEANGGSPGSDGEHTEGGGEDDGPLIVEADSFLQVIGWVEKSITEPELDD